MSVYGTGTFCNPRDLFFGGGLVPPDFGVLVTRRHGAPFLLLRVALLICATFGFAAMVLATRADASGRALASGARCTFSPLIPETSGARSYATGANYTVSSVIQIPGSRCVTGK